MKKFIPSFLLSIYHWAWALSAALVYRFPSRKIVVIGITGTNGKSTVVHLTHEIFKEAGYKVASLSSIRFIVDDQEEKNMLKMTMPGRLFVQRFLRRAVDAHCDVAILEVTSEGIKQFRHAFIDFDTAALTNITPEHIESHGSFERYRATKLKLFQALAVSPKRGKTIVLNGDDKAIDLFIQHKRSNAWIYGLRPSAWGKHGTVVMPEHLTIHEDGIRFGYRGVECSLAMRGEFNVYNALCALSIALSRGIEPRFAAQAFEKNTQVPGRLERIIAPPLSVFSVIVDYAHTPDALEQVYKTLKKPNSRLVCVLGSAGGGRDKWKRAEMGKIADQWCDDIVLTNEDPYDEDPEHIMQEVARGITVKKPTIVLDRKEGIAAAMKKAHADDTVIITGKGAEPWMVVAGGRKIPWDDREVVRDIFKT